MNNEDDSKFGQMISQRVVAIGLVFLCCGLIAATGYRIIKDYSAPSLEFNWNDRGHSDFHNGTYYPSLAFRNGINPYSPIVRDHYPMSSPSRPCPPITYIAHSPFSFFDLKTADVLFFVYNTGLVLLLAYLSVTFIRKEFHLGWWLLASALLLASRPGHITLFTGYYTLELVIGTLLALHFAQTRPWVSAVGMLIASSKPTFILPLIILMIARKNYRATVIGVVFARSRA